MCKVDHKQQEKYVIQCSYQVRPSFNFLDVLVFNMPCAVNKSHHSHSEHIGPKVTHGGDNIMVWEKGR